MCIRMVQTMSSIGLKERTKWVFASRRNSGAGSNAELGLRVHLLVECRVEDFLTRSSNLSKMTLNFCFKSASIGFLSSSSRVRACGLACKTGAATSEFGIFFFLRPVAISMTIEKTVRVRRNADARLCLDTCSSVSWDDYKNSQGTYDS